MAHAAATGTLIPRPMLPLKSPILQDVFDIARDFREKLKSFTPDSLCGDVLLAIPGAANLIVQQFLDTNKNPAVRVGDLVATVNYVVAPLPLGPITASNVLHALQCPSRKWNLVPLKWIADAHADGRVQAMCSTDPILNAAHGRVSRALLVSLVHLALYHDPQKLRESADAFVSGADGALTHLDFGEPVSREVRSVAAAVTQDLLRATEEERRKRAIEHEVAQSRDKRVCPDRGGGDVADVVVAEDNSRECLDRECVKCAVI